MTVLTPKAHSENLKADYADRLFDAIWLSPFVKDEMLEVLARVKARVEAEAPDLIPV